MGGDRIRVLLVEDDEDDYILTRDLLSHAEGMKFDLGWVKSYDAALEALGDDDHDVCLLDYRLGGHTGLEVLQYAHEHGYRTPMILLTGQGDYEVDVDAMKAGAADYLDKGQLRADLLSRSIRYAIERRRADDELRRSEERLRHAQKMEAIGTLAAGLAHDFNNTLAVVIGYAEFIKGQFEPETPMRCKVEMIEEAADEAANLTRQLLTFSRKQAIQPKILSLNATVAKMENMLRRLLREDTNIVTIPDPALWPVKADPNQVEQVLMNLIVNARDAMPHGGKITLETANVELNDEDPSAPVDIKPGAYVMLAVSDTGCGMDETTQTRIFEPFFTTKELGKGTGLGLSVAYGIVRQGGGDIVVRSKVDKGTTFELYFPQAEGKIEETIASAAVISTHGGDETILLVEDDLRIRSLISEVLRTQGYTVLVARNMADALHINDKYTGPIHLLLSDLVMPQMGGSELARTLMIQRPNMQVIFLTSHTDGFSLHEDSLPHSVSVLYKPFRQSDLFGKVCEALEQWKKDARLEQGELFSTVSLSSRKLQVGMQQLSGIPRPDTVPAK